MMYLNSELCEAYGEEMFFLNEQIAFEEDMKTAFEDAEMTDEKLCEMERFF